MFALTAASIGECNIHVPLILINLIYLENSTHTNYAILAIIELHSYSCMHKRSGLKPKKKNLRCGRSMRIYRPAHIYIII